MRTLHLLTILTLAISSNFDNLGVGIVYGIRGTCIPFAANLLIALITGAGTLLSMLVGTTLHHILKPQLAIFLGGMAMIGIGAWVIVQAMGCLREAKPSTEQLQDARKVISQHIMFSNVVKFLDDPFFLDKICSTHIHIRETVLLGVALTLNNLVNGVAAGMLGLNLFLVTSFVAIFSILAIWAGRSAGRSSRYRWIGNVTGPVSGLLLISIGVYEIFF
jgi:putative sporulation protein YtaF